MKINDFAKLYEPQKCHNIAELEKVRTDIEVEEEVRKNQEGEEYNLIYTVIENEEYRIPTSVLIQLKTILEAKPDLEFFKVARTGKGMLTKYQVIQL